MTSSSTLDPNAGLARQALKRPISGPEQKLANCMEQIFKSGVCDFDLVATLLQQNAIEPPSGAPGPWSKVLLEQELRLVNGSLDQAYRGQ